MKRRYLLAFAAVPLLTLVAPSSAGNGPTQPVLREYPSPVGAGPVGPPVVGQIGLADHAAEPTVGINSKTGAVLFIAGTQTLKVGGFDAKGKGSSVWTDITDPIEGLNTFDPILYTDPDTGRTFVNQLQVTGCSLQAFTDNDGASYTNSVLGCGGMAFDHQTLVTGKPAPGTKQAPLVGYPNYLYYCTNDVGSATCATSVNGGLTFLPAVPVYLETGDCGGIFGHIKTSPVDGALYLMTDGCGGTQGIWRSDDNALTWTFHPIPGTTVGNGGHPSIAVARDGTLYASWTSTLEGSNEGPVQVAVSRDKGRTWSKPVALGRSFGVRYTTFPVAVAGDGDRAAVGYLGAVEEGTPRAADYAGTWRLYVSSTYDGGKTWRTVNATPRSPIQVGSICVAGLTACQLGNARNLLDFNDMDLDPQGRLVIALADGCLKDHDCTSRDRLDKGLIVRQVGGTRFFRKPAK